jgi:hypothetical protein
MVLASVSATGSAFQDASFEIGYGEIFGFSA